MISKLDIRSEKHTVSSLELDHAIKKVFRRLKVGKWIGKKAENDFFNLMRTGKLSRLKLLAYLHYDHKLENLHKELKKVEHKRSVLTYLNVEGDIKISRVENLISFLEKRF